ncbi:VOC family protein [Nocardioidaceae bacterium]|nr:VOC family protein [Nocardioidaceae bacterium]
MSAELVPYLMFSGDARAALELYHATFGGEVEVMTFADMGGMGLPEDQHDLIMHASLSAPGVHVFVSDTPESMGEAHANGSMALAGSDTTTLRGWWDALAEGGTVDVPLEKAPWGDLYGQVKDRFGVDWMFNVADDTATG